MSERLPPIGTLPDRVVLERATSEGFAPLATVWARVRRLSAPAGSPSHSVVVRFRTDLREGDRIMHRGKPLSILSVGDINGRRAYLSIACDEAAP